MNETWTGVGVARPHFLEFMQPYETECVNAAHEAGYMVSFHNCGRATLFLEDIADTGPDAVETLTSNRSSGDVDLADAKAAHRRPRLPLRRLQRAPAQRGRRGHGQGGGRALPRRRDGRRRLRPALDRADLLHEARADRGHVRDGARLGVYN